ncbi:MAG: HNH endonuclease [Nanoarchaeota archaeon]
MFDILNKYDIINSLVGEADFLCQHDPLVCEERLTVNPTNRRTRVFLLGGKMSRITTQKTKEKIRKSVLGRKKSEEHKRKISQTLKGKFIGCNNSNWKGGKIKRNGYVRISQFNHPFANSIGYVREHRLVMEKHLGRYLQPFEITHHINGIKTDNRLKNLMLFISNSAHKRFEKNGIVKPEEIILDGRIGCPR